MSNHFFSRSILNSPYDYPRQHEDLYKTGHPTGKIICHYFVYKRVPHITLKYIADNAKTEVIWKAFEKKKEPLRKGLNAVLKTKGEKWGVVQEAEDSWSNEIKKLHADFRKQRNKRQNKIDASKTDYEFLYNKPYEKPKKLWVVGPFIVKNLSPHQTQGKDEDDELMDVLTQNVSEEEDELKAEKGFVPKILENLKTAGIMQAQQEDRIIFRSLTPWAKNPVFSDKGRIRVRGNCLDVFHPNFEEGRSSGPEGISSWFIENINYNKVAFFVRHAFFFGAKDTYKYLKTTLKAEIDADVWAILNNDSSNPVDKPASGRISVKVISHLGLRR